MGAITAQSRIGLTAVLLLLALSLTACSSGWRAPLDDRGAPPQSHKGPEPPVKTRKPPRPGATHYRVQRGDTLYAIAWRSDKDFRELARWNRISAPYTIYVGQRLRLTAPKSAKPAPPPTRKAPPPSRSAPPPQRKPAKKPQPPKSAPPARALAWKWPNDGRVISRFHPQDPLRKGIKLSGKKGAPVRAAEAGKVVYSGSGLIGYGRLIIVKHNDKYLSAYGHNRKLLVREGERVTKGQKIAELGTSNDGQAMLHFEIRRDGKPVNPIRLLPRR